MAMDKLKDKEHLSSFFIFSDNVYHYAGKYFIAPLPV